MVSISVIAALAGILVPVLNNVRYKAYEIKSMNNLRGIGTGLITFSNDNQGYFAPSVATVGSSDTWTWYDPRRLVGSKQRTPRIFRSMSAYLFDYIDPELLHCPDSPSQYKHLKEMWKDGEDWDSPTTDQDKDPMSGSYCHFWGYDGLVETEQGVKRFRGPRRPGDGKRYSNLLSCDYFGYGNSSDQTPPNLFASCERFDTGEETETNYIAPHWAGLSEFAGELPDDVIPDQEQLPRIRLKAVFSDGHVSQYTEQDVVMLNVIKRRDTLETFGLGGGDTPGVFYIPEEAMK